MLNPDNFDHDDLDHDDPRNDKFYGDEFHQWDLRENTAYYAPGARDTPMSAYAEEDGMAVYSEGIVTYTDAAPVKFVSFLSFIGSVPVRLIGMVFDNLRFGGVAIDREGSIKFASGEMTDFDDDLSGLDLDDDYDDDDDDDDGEPSYVIR
jgi:hypothetical protein